MELKNILFIAYYYPPVGGGGVQRTVKFVKYLPDFGYRPVVIGGTGGDNRGISNDVSMSQEIASTKHYIINPNGWERMLRRLSSGRFGRLIPGLSFRWWTAGVQRISDQIIRDNKPEAIYVSVSAYQAAKVAARLARQHGLPWVLDMRDPWALDPINYYPTLWHYRLERAAMRRACQQADAVIMNTPRSQEALIEAFPELDREKVFCITNGWDPSMFTQRDQDQTETTRDHRPLTIMHSGAFHTRLALQVDRRGRNELGLPMRRFDWIKYSSGRSHILARTPYYLLKAIRKLIEAGDVARKDLSVVFTGDITEEDKALIDRFHLGDILKFKGYMTHGDSVRCLLKSDVLFLPLHIPQNGQYPLIVPGKTYEYMAAKKPVLALVPPGDAHDFFLKSGLGFVCPPDDVKHIANTLRDLLRRHRSLQGIVVEPNETFINDFNRKDLTGKLARVFDFVTDSGTHTPVRSRKCSASAPEERPAS